MKLRPQDLVYASLRRFQPVMEGLSASVDGYSEGRFDYLLAMCERIYDEVLRPLWLSMSEVDRRRFSDEGWSLANSVEPDGSSDAFASTGTINIYLGRLPADWKPKIAANLPKMLSSHNILAGTIVTEESKSRDGMVMRVPIVKNAKRYNGPPELGMTPSSAEVILNKLLKLGVTAEGGSVDAKTLLDRLNNVKDYHARNSKVAATSTTGEEGATIINMGLPESRINDYLSRLREIADWTISNGYSRIVFN